MLSLILLLVSGIGWTIVYIACIKIGIRQKTYCMPVFALALNIAWEAIYAFNGASIAASEGGPVDPQTIANGAWLICDAGIVITFLRYGRRWMPDALKGHFGIVSALIFLTGLGFQLAFYLHLPWLEAAQYSAFAQNVIMSVLFVAMYFYRKGPEGQSLVIAVAKCVGTLAPTLQQGLIDGLNIYILIMGALCFVWDVAYIALLAKNRGRREARA